MYLSPCLRMYLQCFKNWSYQKIVKIKICPPKSIFSYKNHMQKDSADFWNRKMTLKMKHLLFLMASLIFLVIYMKKTIFNMICWVAGSMEWMTHRPSVWCSKHYFFIISYRLKANVSQEKCSLMPCLRTFSNVLF